MTGHPAKILVVEDEGVLAMAIEEILGILGYEVVGPAPNTKRAMKLLDGQTIDGALLDVNLGGERVDCVAEALAAASIPFAFTTGYSDISALPPGFRDRATLYKPFRPEQLQDVLIQMLAT
jgi:CheY-like chemotaxis protein